MSLTFNICNRVDKNDLLSDIVLFVGKRESFLLPSASHYHLKLDNLEILEFFLSLDL
jgi:hypothetical protein